MNTRNQLAHQRKSGEVKKHVKIASENESYRGVEKKVLRSYITMYHSDSE